MQEIEDVRESDFISGRRERMKWEERKGRRERERVGDRSERLKPF